MSFTENLADLVEGNRSGLLSIHPSWQRVHLHLVADVLNGFAFSSVHFTKGDGVPLLRIRDILLDTTEAYYNGKFEPAYLVTEGDLVVGMDGDFNCALWHGPEALLNQRVCKLTAEEQFYDKRFLAYALPGYLRAINEATSSITVKHLSSRTVEEIPLPLPPRPEQDRIVGEIEKQFTRLDDAVAALKRVRANLKRYRASVLKAACEGRLVPTEAELARKEGRSYEPANELLKRILTERRAKWEADQLAKITTAGNPPKNDQWKKKYKEPEPPDTSSLPGLPKGWLWATLDQIICSGPQNGLYMPANAYGQGTPIVRIEDYQFDRTPNSRELKRVRIGEQEVMTYGLLGGDILLNRVNSPSHLGKCMVVPGELSSCVFESNMMRLRVSDELNAGWVIAVLQTATGRDRLTANAKWAVNQASINQQDVRRTAVPLPPRAEHLRVLNAIDEHLSDTLHVLGEVEEAGARSDRLRQSILRQAFEGSLVQHDPADEPASVLLDRIRKERAANLTAGPVRQRRPRSVKVGSK